MQNKVILRSAFVLILATACLATVIPYPPTENTIRGTWIGFTSSANDFYRLTLHEKNIGAFASIYIGQKAKLYRIDSWKLEERQLTINISAISTNAYPILLSGRAWPNRIEFKIQDPNGGWEQNAILYREELLEKNFKALKSAMGDDERH